VVGCIFRLIYKFIETNIFYLNDDQQRIHILVWYTCINLIKKIIISFNLYFRYLKTNK